MSTEETINTTITESPTEPVVTVTTVTTNTSAPAPAPVDPNVEVYKTPTEITTEDITIVGDPTEAFVLFNKSIKWFHILIAISVIAIIFIIIALLALFSGEAAGAITSWMFSIVCAASAGVVWYYKVKTV